ncbi:MAG: hypothetical protein K6T83_06695 [Alicyclobacillus sp.]|nr:hypothetical protein [Alicyclobacillus sp.]
MAKHAINFPNVQGFLHGGDYNPDRWLRISRCWNRTSNRFQGLAAYDEHGYAFDRALVNR